jgi:hypothetical protein
MVRLLVAQAMAVQLLPVVEVAEMIASNSIFGM